MSAKEDKLYHYTDYNSLFGMLRNKELWLGNISGMNDKLEVVGYINNLEFYIQRSLPKFYKGDNKLITQKKIVSRYTNFHNKMMKFKGELNPFALCFSKNEDDAAMWERYANNARGVCIEFNESSLENIFLDSEFGLINENYNLDIEPFILELVEQYFLAEESEYADNLFSLMLLQACSHKHIGFNSENEVRLVTPYPDSVNSEYEEIRYVTNAERIRKVLVLRLENFCKFKDVPYDNLLQKLISSIIIGPRSLQNLSDLKSFLLDLNLNDLANQVYESSCPLR